MKKTLLVLFFAIITATASAQMQQSVKFIKSLDHLKLPALQFTTQLIKATNQQSNININRLYRRLPPIRPYGLSSIKLSVPTLEPPRILYLQPLGECEYPSLALPISSEPDKMIDAEMCDTIPCPILSQDSHVSADSIIRGDATTHPNTQELPDD